MTAGSGSTSARPRPWASWSTSRASPGVGAPADRPGAQGVLATAAEVVEALRRAVGEAAAAPVGVGVPGVVDPVRGAVKHAVNLGVDGDRWPSGRGWPSRSASGPLENDVNAATLGVVALTHATTSSTSASARASPRGWCSTAGCAGVTRAPPERSGTCPSTRPALCSCGQRGCLETLASGSALAAAWPTAAGHGPVAVRGGRGR